MLGVPPNTLPLVIYIGIFCYWVLLRYNMSFKTIACGFNGAFWWYGPLSEDQENFNKSTKTLSWLEVFHKILKKKKQQLEIARVIW